MQKTCAQILVDEAIKQGIDIVFGIPGVHNLPIYSALAERNMRHVTPRHEQSAAFMADGFARASGKPAACVLISGPGVLNAATAIGQAYSDSIPMVILATVTARMDIGLGRGRLHDMPDQLSSMAGLLQGQAVRLNHPAQSVPALRKIMSRMVLSRPRPGYIEVPLDVASAEIDASDLGGGTSRLERPAAAAEAASAAARMLAEAKRPLVIAGGGAVEAGGALASLIENLGAVIVTTIAGKGVVPETHPRSLGASMNHQSTRRILEEADLVLAVGTELASPDHFLDLLTIQAPLIRIDVDPEVLNRDQIPALGLLADASIALTQIVEALGDSPARSCWRRDCARVREGRLDELRRARPRHTAVLDALHASLPGDAIIATDMTQIAYTGNGYYSSGVARSWLHPVGFGTLGYGLPAAIGAKLAFPNRSVIALTGDFGVGFTLAELATAADLRLNLPVLVWNNDGLGQIADDMDAAGLPRIGVDVRAPVFARLAEGYHAGYRKVDRVSDLSAALDDGFAARGPTLIEVPATLSLE